MSAGLADGEWHRLHPATPLLKGGIVLIAILGLIISNLRERIIDFFVGGPAPSGDPIDEIYDRGLTGWALLAALVVILLIILVFYISWRMSSFRVSAESVEVRSGILFRSHRTARLDRIQGINVRRPVLARILGAARLEVVVAGHDANVHLAYLGTRLAEELRLDIMRLASGVKQAERQAQQTGQAPNRSLSAILEDRIGELANPADLNPDAAPPASIVHMHPLRLVGSIILSGFTLVLLVILALIVVGASTGRLWLLFILLPGVIGALGYYTRRFGKSVRYTISGSADGVRLGFGLLSTSSETIPPGRIHAVEVLQPLIWRPFGWWRVRINKAGHSRQRGDDGESNTTMLPVGNASDVERVLQLLLPGMDGAQRDALARAGMTKDANGALFSKAPSRARWLRPFSWKRAGYTIVDGIVVLRHGVVWRRLIFVPLARMQGVKIEQGPVHRLFSLASARVDTVEGSVRPELSVIDVGDALTLFDTVAAGAIAWSASDTSHRWNAEPGQTTDTTESEQEQ